MMGVNWNRTVRLEERLKGSPFYEESEIDGRVGKFAGSEIISRDTPINGGVYLGGGAREAIVIDDKKDAQLLNSFAELMELIVKKKAEGQDYKKGLLREIFELAKNKLPYDAAEVSRIIAKLGLDNDRKIALGSFIVCKAGVCRHQALLVAYLLERLNNEGLINGRVSIDRNSISGMGGHAWVRYTTAGGEAIIIDPAQNYYGRLSEVPQNKWFYARPEDEGDEK